MMGKKWGIRKSSIRCWQAAVTADFPAVDGVVVDACKHAGEPGLWIDVVELGGLCRARNYAESFFPDSSADRRLVSSA